MDLPRRSIPSVAGLVAFEATARHLSFSRAAEDLCLSQGAVSKRVRQLEQVLGVPLLARTKHQVCLTEIGRTYFAQVRQLLENLEMSTQALRIEAEGKDRITIGAPLSFAARWLIPRLHRFREAHPGVSVDVMTTDQRSRPGSDSDLDCIVHYGQPRAPDMLVSHLFEIAWVPVASPALRDRLKLTALADLRRAGLIEQGGMGHLWSDWLALSGLPDIARSGPRLDGLELVIAAAIAGHGVALVPRTMVADELKAHELAILFESPALEERGYYLATPARLTCNPTVTAFADWMVGEAGQFVHRLHAA